MFVVFRKLHDLFNNFFNYYISINCYACISVKEMSVMNGDGTRNIWKVDEVHFLLYLVKKHNVLDQLKHKFKSTEVYTKLERYFIEGGYNRTAIQLRHKLKALKSSYNQAIKESLRDGTKKPSCDFYEELDELFKFNSSDLKSNLTLDTGNKEVDQDHPAELVEILLKGNSGDEEVEMVYVVEKPNQSNYSEENIAEAVAGSSGLKRLGTPDCCDPPKRKKKELDGDGLLDKFLEYQRKADEKAAKLFREAEERAQDRADARMRESMAILSSTINSLFEKCQSKSNSPYSANNPPPSVTLTFNPQGQINVSPYTPPSEAPSPILNSNFQNSSHYLNTMHNHHKDHSYSPNS